MGGAGMRSRLLRTKSWRAEGAGAGAPGQDAAHALRPLRRAAAQAQYPGLRRSYSASSRSYRTASSASKGHRRAHEAIRVHRARVVACVYASTTSVAAVLKHATAL